MELQFQHFAAVVAAGIEVAMILVILLGTAQALFQTLRCLARRQGQRPMLREIWLRYAAWIVLALEFALAADLIGTVVSPSWEQIGQLAAIGAIRTALSYFLARDIREVSEFAPVRPHAEHLGVVADGLGVIPDGPRSSDGR